MELHGEIGRERESLGTTKPVRHTGGFLECWKTLSPASSYAALSEKKGKGSDTVSNYSYI